MRVLILFSSFDGQTGRIAQRVGEAFTAAGHAVALRSADEPGAGEEIERHDAVVAGGAIRYGGFSRALLRLVRAHRTQLADRPNAFFHVSLSARPGGNPAEVSRYLEQFSARTGWQPRECASFAGALPYRRYNPLLRLVMRLISAVAGGDTDTSRDYEYTDWQAVERFATRIASSLGIAAAA